MVFLSGANIRISCKFKKFLLVFRRDLCIFVFRKKKGIDEMKEFVISEAQAETAVLVGLQSEKSVTFRIRGR